MNKDSLELAVIEYIEGPDERQLTWLIGSTRINYR
mgnify:CR=1 FL=1